MQDREYFQPTSKMRRRVSLLALIAQTQPDSLNDLAEKTGRAKSNLSRTLKTMERYGLVHFKKGAGRQLAPRVKYSGVKLEMIFR